MWQRVIAAAVLLFTSSATAQPPVDLALVLAVDVSGSVDAEEYQTQHNGYAEAFRNVNVIGAIQSGEMQQIAVTLVHWSAGQKQAVAWMVVRDEATALAFADAIEKAPRSFSDWTGLSEMMIYSAALFDSCGCSPTRRVIDVSGDGINNSGGPPIAARNEIVARGITINGLPILTDDPQLDIYYEDNVIGGENAFQIPAKDFGSFSRALLGKLVREIAMHTPVRRHLAFAVRP